MTCVKSCVSAEQKLLLPTRIDDGGKQPGNVGVRRRVDGAGLGVVARERRRAGAVEALARDVRALHEVPLVALQRLLLAVVEGTEHVPALRCQVAVAAEQAADVDLAATFLRNLHLAANTDALVLLARDVVDHACDRVRAVGRGRAVLQYLDPLKRGRRHRVEVDRDRAVRVVDDALAIEQHQRPLRPQRAQAGVRRATVVPADRTGSDRASGVVLRDRSQHLFGVGDTRALQFRGADARHWQRHFTFNPLDQRARHFDAVQRLSRRLAHGPRCEAGKSCAERSTDSQAELGPLQHGFPLQRMMQRSGRVPESR